jgi:hypothetical protein
MQGAKLGVLVCAFLALPLITAAQADLSGPWVVTVDTPQGKTDIDVMFKQAGQKVTGEVSSPMGNAAFNGTFIDNALAASYSVALQGQTIEIKMNGLLDKDMLSGSLDFGGLAQAPFSAKRKPPSSAAASGAAAAAPVAPTPAGSTTDVTGKWNMSVQMGPNTLPFVGTLQQQGESVTGSIATPLGELPVTGTMAGRTLNLQFTAQTPQGPMVVTMTGELGPEGLNGKSSVAGLGESPWSAKRIE